MTNYRNCVDSESEVHLNTKVTEIEEVIEQPKNLENSSKLLNISKTFCNLVNKTFVCYSIDDLTRYYYFRNV